MKRSQLAFIAVLAMSSTTAFAQTPATAPVKAVVTHSATAAKPVAAKPTAPHTVATAKPMAAKPVKMASGTTTQAPRTAKSLACSKSADSKNLHGQPRETFMASCKRS